MLRTTEHSVTGDLSAYTRDAFLENERATFVLSMRAKAHDRNVHYALARFSVDRTPPGLRMHKAVRNCPSVVDTGVGRCGCNPF